MWILWSLEKKKKNTTVYVFSVRLFTSHVTGLNHAGVQVSPEEALVDVVDREAVGSTHFLHQCHYVAPVHVGPGDPGPAPPLCPVHVAGQRQNTSVSTPHSHSHDYLPLTKGGGSGCCIVL